MCSFEEKYNFKKWSIEVGIKSIKIKNLLSYNQIHINGIKDINCIIGRNNTGKSNLLKLIRFFYAKLERKDAVPPKLNNNYSSYGEISIEYDVTRISKIVRGHKNNNNKFFKQIANTLLKQNYYERLSSFLTECKNEKTFTLSLKINSDESVSWSTKDTKTLNILNHLFPYFDIETRHVDLYDWDKLWLLISKLKSFNIEKISNEEIINFFDSKIGENSNSYSDYLKKIKEITKTTKYGYKEKVLNYVKVGLDGQTFEIDGKKLEVQSDGTNSFKYIEIFLSLLISLTRRDYITPIVFIDEPEIGLHPKKNEQLIENLHDIYMSFKKSKESIEQNKYATPYPNIFMSTHSPNILKSIVKLFDHNQQVLHFSMKNDTTHIRTLNSTYDHPRFLNIFNDNEARLFFSEFILFVEGATELELFSNKLLCKKFQHLRNIDIYATDDLALKYINPSYSNTAIPYLVLYDADHLFAYDKNNNKMTLKTAKISVSNLRNKYKYSFIGSNSFQTKRNMDVFIKDLKDTNIVTDEYHVKIKNLEWNKLISRVNKFILARENYWITSSTIEGALINESSLNLFKKWILHEIRNKINTKNDSNIERIISSHLKNPYQNQDQLLKTCSSLLININHQIPLEKTSRLFVIKLKSDFIRLLQSRLVAFFPTAEIECIALRLLFGGKTETLIATFNNNYSTTIEANFRTNLNILKSESTILSYLTDKKTSGWVTKFIDFSLKEIEKNSADNKEFHDKFRLIFPELSAIFKKLRFR